MSEPDSTTPPLVNIGEFWLEGLGLFKAYLPEDTSRPRQPDLGSEQVTFSQVHPEVRPKIAAVKNLSAEPDWEVRPDWTEHALDDALAKARQLRRAARLRAGLEA